MDNLYNILAQVFGPVVQAVFFFLTLLFAAWCISAAAYWSEQKLIGTKNQIVYLLPFPILAVGLLYGGLRFSGQLFYSTDGWNQWGYWNYTNQNYGAGVLFICVCLLIGVVLAMYKGKNYLKMEG